MKDPQLRPALEWALRTADESAVAPEREREGRATLRVFWNDTAAYLKVHRGIGWRAWLMQLLQLRRPVVDARPEIEALQVLASAGVAVPELLGGDVASGLAPGRRSFVMTRALDGQSDLLSLSEHWPSLKPPEKWALIEQVAQLAANMHAAGVYHRDFYLDHLYMHRAQLGAADAVCTVIDLHRSRMFAELPEVQRVRDLAALWFSAAGLNLSRAERHRFVRAYAAQCDWNRVEQRMHQLLWRESCRSWRRFLQSGDVAPIEWVGQGRSHRVGRLAGPRLAGPQQNPCYIKRYQPQGLLRRAAVRLGLSRLQRSARVQRAMKNLPVAPAVALVREQSTCSLVMQEIEDCQVLASAPLQWTCQSAVQLARSLAHIHRAGFVHGDTKWSNVVSQESRWVWLDLDAVRRSVSWRRRGRDVARFIADAERLSGERAFVVAFADAYANCMGVESSQLRSAVLPRLHNIRTRHQRRYGKQEPVLYP